MSSPFSHDFNALTDSENESTPSTESMQNSQSNELAYIRLQNQRLIEEINIYKMKMDILEKANHDLKKSKCEMQAKVEVEEEFITNSLLKQIALLKTKMEDIQCKYQQEEDFLVKLLKSKLQQLEYQKNRQEKSLENLRKEILIKVNRKIRSLENETQLQRKYLEQLRIDRSNTYNCLQEQHIIIINRLFRNISQADEERKSILDKLNNPDSKLPCTVSPELRRCKSLEFCQKSLPIEEHHLVSMSIQELFDYVLSSLKKLKNIQMIIDSLDKERYVEMLLECNIDPHKHSIKEKIDVLEDPTSKPTNTDNILLENLIDSSASEISESQPINN